LARSANCSLWMLRRLTTTRRPRRTFSEIELIFKESTNVAAALVRAWGMRLHCSLWPYCALAGASHFKRFLISAA
jgi:hypothetical protein